jgi:23S rRNA pseudouridine2605 synthase
MAKKFSKIPSDYSKKNAPLGRPKFAGNDPEKKERKERSYDRPSFGNRERKETDEERQAYEKKEKKTYSSDKPAYDKKERKSYSKDKPAFKRKTERSSDGDKKPYEKRERKPYQGNQSSSDRPIKSDRERTPYDRKKTGDEKPSFERKRTVPSKYKHSDAPKSFEERPKRTFKKEDRPNPRIKTDLHNNDAVGEFYESKAGKFSLRKKPLEQAPAEIMPLNKFIAHCGICSRRDSVELIKKGKITVNGVVELSPGTKVSDTDEVFYDGKRMIAQRKLVYFLLNKPKDYITTTDDPEGRKTVLDLFKGVEDKRIFPVGRLDRNTTGLLLLTNDGELAQKLAHPKHNTKKVYQVGLDKPLAKKDFEAIASGLTLEDGVATVDEIAFIDPKDKTSIGIEIHIGRNRIVRRIFEHLNYQVKTLDRVIYAGLTKKNLPRGKWRALDEKEIIYLKHFK